MIVLLEVEKHIIMVRYPPQHYIFHLNKGKSQKTNAAGILQRSLAKLLMLVAKLYHFICTVELFQWTLQCKEMELL